jgi:enamine deaminase RidA (YjgF/YER057c/UK114 family)
MAPPDLLIEVLGEAGRTARSAIGVSSLPLGFAVEIEAVIRLTQEEEPDD